MDYHAVLMKYVQDYLAEEPDQVNSTSQPLITSGVLDSLCLIEIQLFVRDEFGIVVPDQKMIVANFDTIDLAVRTIIGCA